MKLMGYVVILHLLLEKLPDGFPKQPDLFTSPLKVYEGSLHSLYIPLHPLQHLLLFVSLSMTIIVDVR
jgi:hypothetical protein